MNEPRIQKLQSLIEAGNLLVSDAKTKGTSAGLWSTVVAGESIRKSDSYDTARDTSAISAQKIGVSMNYAMERAGATILAAAANPQEFVSRVATESANTRYANYMNVAHAGADLTVDYGRDNWTQKLGKEYYTDTDLDKNLGLSWALNVRALEIQSQFAEKLFPTITVEGTDVGITVRTKITTVTRGILHALLEKDSVVDDRKPLHWALSDHKVLEDDAIRIVPYLMPDGKNAEFFVDSNLIEPETVRLGRVPAYETNFLRADLKKFNLFQLSAHPGIVSGGYDETDEVAPGACVGRFLVAVREKGDPLADSQFVELIVRDMQFATFDRPLQGDGRELVIQFRRNLFTVNGNSRDRKGDEIIALDAFKQRGLSVNYTINMSGSMFSTGQRGGDVDITGLGLSIESLYDAEGNELPITSGSNKSLVDNLVMEVYGFKIDSTRTNENRRSQGLMLDPVWEQENYKLQYGSPIMTKSPVGIEYNDTERLDDLLSALNIRNELLAVGQTIAYTEQIRQVHATMVSRYQTLSIRGLGRHWVGAWFKEDVFDVSKIVQSLETKDALINARQALLQRIGDQVVTAIQDARYIQSMRLLVADPAAVPSVIIATDEPTAAMLLLNQGEARLLGDRYQYEVITTNDDRWRKRKAEDGSWSRRLQWFLKVPTQDDGSYCVLNWGNHFWSPVMVTNINIQRNGPISKELAVQPRNAHINHCPITGLLWVEGITDLVAKKLAYMISTLTAGVGVGGDNAGNVGGDTGAGTGGSTAPTPTP